MPFPPSEYAAYANAIVGKPLALVNTSWSIELAEAPYWRQHTLPASPNPEIGATVDPLRTEATANMDKYHFKVKISDAERPFDGVVAYWDNEWQHYRQRRSQVVHDNRLRQILRLYRVGRDKGDQSADRAPQLPELDTVFSSSRVST
ncbi:hypothetical protein GJ744_009147 [Endocarpon pusillum]|uniref:Uncharacterized protein n=1 Tax=Endocarpon pusillum TaxID=364733 RepID=A0A8H7AGJ9_9EURO|nr:hypothetical protein GJ744_009147 [Endocarpon pusillum]